MSPVDCITEYYGLAQIWANPFSFSRHILTNDGNPALLSQKYPLPCPEKRTARLSHHSYDPCIFAATWEYFHIGSRAKLA